MASGFHPLDDGLDGVIERLDMFQHADAGDKIKGTGQPGAGNIVVYDVVMAVDHPRGPIVADIVGCRDKKSAIAHKMRKGRGAGSDIQNGFGVQRRQFPENECIFDRALVEAEDLLLEFLSTHPPRVGI